MFYLFNLIIVYSNVYGTLNLYYSFVYEYVKTQTYPIHTHQRTQTHTDTHIKSRVFAGAKQNLIFSDQH